MGAVVFDLGGVLIDWDPRYLYRRLFGGDQAAMEVFLAEVCTPQWNAGQDAGRPWGEAVAELSARHPEARELILAFDQRWEEMLGGPIEGSVELLAELRAARLPLYALSNWSAAKFPIARARYPFLGWFRDVVISGEVGLLKPDPAIYRLLLDRQGLLPRHTLYVDDSEPNVDAARRVGMRALHFRDAGTLRRELAAMGLLEPGLMEARPTL
ncbi:MAG: HAD family hydrolase [Candidatus Limnocylindrales bacterium]